MNILETAQAMGTRYVAILPIDHPGKALLDQLPETAVIVDMAEQAQPSAMPMNGPVMGSQALTTAIPPDTNAGLALAVQLGLQGARNPQREAAARLASKPAGKAFQAKRGPRPQV